jgi:hypothetical protein
MLMNMHAWTLIIAVALAILIALELWCPVSESSVHHRLRTGRDALLADRTHRPGAAGYRCSRLAGSGDRASTQERTVADTPAPPDARLNRNVARGNMAAG